MSTLKIRSLNTGYDPHHFNVVCGVADCAAYEEVSVGVTRKPIKKAIVKLKAKGWTGYKDRMICPECSEKI